MTTDKLRAVRKLGTIRASLELSKPLKKTEVIECLVSFELISAMLLHCCPLFCFSVKLSGLTSVKLWVAHWMQFYEVNAAVTGIAATKDSNKVGGGSASWSSLTGRDGLFAIREKVLPNY